MIELRVRAYVLRTRLHVICWLFWLFGRLVLRRYYVCV